MIGNGKLVMPTKDLDLIEKAIEKKQLSKHLLT